MTDSFAWNKAIQKMYHKPEEVTLEAFGCAVRVVDEVLETKPLDPDGNPTEDDWVEVTEPQSEAFLSEVNDHLGTEFTMEKFLNP